MIEKRKRKQVIKIITYFLIGIIQLRVLDTVRTDLAEVNKKKSIDFFLIHTPNSNLNDCIASLFFSK